MQYEIKVLEADEHGHIDFSGKIVAVLSSSPTTFMRHDVAKVKPGYEIIALIERRDQSDVGLH